MPDRFMTDARFRGLFYAFMVVTLAGAAATMIAMLVVLQAINERGKDNRSIIDGIATTNKTILDCTEETGECFREGRERTAETVTGIGDNTYRLIVAGLSCQADGIVDEKPLADCMAKRAQQIKAPVAD